MNTKIRQIKKRAVSERKKCDKVLITCIRYVLGYRQPALSTSLAAERFVVFHMLKYL